ncbi:radical SAM protein [bacterium]|nr:radical SAM protein [bacterium]
MNNSIIKAPVVVMKELESVFFVLTMKNCNLRCSHCYIDFPRKPQKDFISLDKIKTSLSQLRNSGVKYLHLSGAEPMLHPDFNTILRMCLRVSSVVIHTNGTMINDKKARFLRKVEDEKNNDNEIIFRVGIDHFDEETNDSIRGRGSYRKSMNAVKSLYKYDFNPILTIVNHFDLDESVIKTEFSKICSEFGFEVEDLNFKIIPLLKKGVYKNAENIDYSIMNTDCSRSRTVSANGVFTCPLLSDDNRGLTGSDISDFSPKAYIESDFCTQCVKNNKSLFCFDWV